MCTGCGTSGCAATLLNASVLTALTEHVLGPLPVEANTAAPESRNGKLEPGRAESDSNEAVDDATA
eukprot:2412797-Rhodomonas_salina.1